jgi:glycosyltransferase 2 family protein
MTRLTSRPDSPRKGSGILTLLAKIVVSSTLLSWLLWQTDTDRLLTHVRHASFPWLASALALYLFMIVASAWRWGLLLAAQRVSVPHRTLLGSFLVATFFNNFLPSNIGGDVVRIRDTTREAGSLTRATAIVVVDRILGLLALLLVAALAATLAGAMTDQSAMPLGPPLLWLGFVAGTAGFLGVLFAPHALAKLLSPFRLINREWVDARLQRLTGIVAAFRGTPGPMIFCFLGAIGVQGILVAFYVAVARALAVPISPVHLAVVVPVSFVLQLIPVSVNGFGVREAAFSYYFVRLHLPVESAVMLSLVGAGVILLFSLSGGLLYMLRQWPASGTTASGATEPQLR